MPKIKPLLPLISTILTVATTMACGSSPPINQPKQDPIPLTESSSTAPAHPPASTPAPPLEASATPPTASAEKPKPMPAGTPMVVSEGEREVTAAFGTGGGIIRIGGVTDLSLPRESLGEMLGFTFGLNTGKSMLKITPYKGQIGDVYRIFVFREASSTEPVSLTTASTPFLLKLPLKGAKTANLVIATSEKGKAKYAIHPPKTVLTADTGDTIVFELNTLPGEGILHLTSAPPTP